MPTLAIAVGALQWGAARPPPGRDPGFGSFHQGISRHPQGVPTRGYYPWHNTVSNQLPAVPRGIPGALSAPARISHSPPHRWSWGAAATSAASARGRDPDARPKETLQEPPRGRQAHTAPPALGMGVLARPHPRDMNALSGLHAERGLAPLQVPLLRQAHVGARSRSGTSLRPVCGRAWEETVNTHTHSIYTQMKQKDTKYRLKSHFI